MLMSRRSAPYIAHRIGEPQPCRQELRSNAKYGSAPASAGATSGSSIGRVHRSTYCRPQICARGLSTGPDAHAAAGFACCVYVASQMLGDYEENGM